MSETSPKPSSSKLDRWALALCTVAILMAIMRFVPAVRLSTLYAAGRSPVCPYELAIDSENMIRDHMAKMGAMKQGSRVLEEDGQGYRLWETPRGKFWTPADDSNETLISILVEQQNAIYGGVAHGVRAGDIVIDCGAHVGAFTKAAVAAGAAHVVAVEPSPVNLIALKRNLAEEIEKGLVTVVEKGVWNEESTLPFYIDPTNSAGSSVLLGQGYEHGDGHVDHSDAEAEKHIVEVPLTTLDNIVAELGLDQVSFIKLDIEGSERYALEGGRNTLARFKPRIGCAAYHMHDDQTKIPEVVMAANPEYKLQCGPCGEKDGWIYAHTLNFY